MSFSTDSHCSPYIVFHLSNHSSHISVFFIPSPRVLSFCLIFPMQVSVEEQYLSPLLQVLLTGSCFLLCFLMLHFPPFLSFSNYFLPISLVPLLQQYLCCLKIPVTLVYSMSILSPNTFSFLPLLSMTINLVSETSLHSSPRSVEVEFNIRLLFRQSYFIHPLFLKAQKDKILECAL